MITSTIVSQLQSIVGKENVFTDKADLICYSFDSTPKPNLPGVVVAPRNTKEVAKVIQLANQEKIPVMPRGAGTCLSGGAVPVDGSIVLAIYHMNKILEIDVESMTTTVQPGVVLTQLHMATDKLGLFYPPDPQSMNFCTLGGNLAENAGGPRCFKYGITRDYVLGLEVVTASGEILRIGGKNRKIAPGYDLIGAFVGSEGTLGVITEATLKLVPATETKYTCLALFDTFEDATKAVSAIVANKVIPTTLELMDGKQMRNIEAFKPVGFPLDVEGALLIEVDGSKETVEWDMKQVEECCKKNGCRIVDVAKTPADATKLWAGRRSSFGAGCRLAKHSFIEDVTVPRSKIPEMAARIYAIGKKYNLNLNATGHAGDGNLHPAFRYDDPNDLDFMERIHQAIDETLLAGLELGGTLSGEHGIGTSKLKYMKAEFGDVGLDLMGKLKRAWDPNNIMNPGKVLPGGYEYE